MAKNRRTEKPKKPNAAAPTAAELAEYYRDDVKRREHENAAADIEKKQAPTKKKIAAYVEAVGGEARSTVHRGWKCHFVSMGRRLDFKALLIKLLGLAKLQRLRKKATVKYRLVVEPADEPAVS